MKYIKQYEINESSSSKKESLGFAISLVGVSWDRKDAGEYMILGINKTFFHFAQAVCEDLGLYPDDNGISEIKSFYDLENMVSNVFYSSMITFWSGLNPRGGAYAEDEYHTESLYNPIKVVDTGKKIFSNFEEILRDFPNGNAEDCSYIPKSIEADPEEMSRYANVDPKSLEYKALQTLASSTDRNIKAQLRLLNIKDMI
jgi:hypothetical protein